jgi:hypothetical protein
MYATLGKAVALFGIRNLSQIPKPQLLRFKIPLVTAGWQQGDQIGQFFVYWAVVS